MLDLVGSGRSDLSVYDRSKYGSLPVYADEVLEIERSVRERPGSVGRALRQRDDWHARGHQIA